MQLHSAGFLNCDYDCDYSGLDLKAYYEAEESVQFRNLKEAADQIRFRRAARCLPKNWSSLLDIGCAEGYWLDFLGRTYGNQMILRGYEYASNRVEKAKTRFPHLDIQQGSIFELPEADGSYDVVTCMEVIEHLAEWRSGVEELLRVARKTVIIGVPYREKIKETMCIHCHQKTPHAGHLHTFDESSFDPWRDRYQVRFSYLSGKRSFVSQYLDRLRRHTRWLLVRISP